jgi:sugar O-acyltransferase (sialic acid O-acetyltransferase NeuD family)
MQAVRYFKGSRIATAFHRPSHPLPIDREVIVLGAGGHAKVILSILLQAGANVTGIYDDDPAKRGTRVLRVPVLGSISEWHDTKGRRCVIGVGDNATRARIAARFPSADWLTVVHPKAHAHQLARLGAGSMVVAGAVVDPGACVGRHCIINTGATVDQDCVVGNFCHIGPGCALGRAVTLADGVFMGIGSVALHNATIGAWTIVGAGAAVVRDLPDHVVAVGVPARVCRKLQT